MHSDVTSHHPSVTCMIRSANLKQFWRTRLKVLTSGCSQSEWAESQQQHKWKDHSWITERFDPNHVRCHSRPVSRFKGIMVVFNCSIWSGHWDKPLHHHILNPVPRLFPICHFQHMFVCTAYTERAVMWISIAAVWLIHSKLTLSSFFSSSFYVSVFLPSSTLTSSSVWLTFFVFLFFFCWCSVHLLNSSFAVIRKEKQMKLLTQRNRISAVDRGDKEAAGRRRPRGNKDK